MSISIPTQSFADIMLGTRMCPEAATFSSSEPHACARPFCLSRLNSDPIYSISPLARSSLPEFVPASGPEGVFASLPFRSSLVPLRSWGLSGAAAVIGSGFSLPLARSSLTGVSENRGIDPSPLDTQQSASNRILARVHPFSHPCLQEALAGCLLPQRFV